MNVINNIFGSSLGKKYVMAGSGALLFLFVVGHLVGNLQVFGPPEMINRYAHFLKSTPELLWVVRLGMLTLVALHIMTAIQLSLENKAARPVGYSTPGNYGSTWQSRYMLVSGLVILAFIVYHLAHFTLGFAQAGTFKSALPHWTMLEDAREFGFPLASKGDVVHDVYSMVYLGFANPVVSIFYIIAVGLLSVHMLHGIDSLFQTIGWRSAKWSCGLRKVALIYCILYFLGNLAIPGAILTGLLKPAEGTYAATKIAAPATPSGTVPR